MSQCIISARDHGYPEIAPVALHELDPIIGSRTMLSLRNLLDTLRFDLAPNFFGNLMDSPIHSRYRNGAHLFQFLEFIRKAERF